MGARTILVLVAVACVWIQTTKAQSCPQQLDNFRQCVRSQIAKDQSDPTASDSKRQKIRSDFSSCATQNGCQDPYPPESERQARESCFSEARNALRQDVQSCVQQQDRSFQLPGDDNDKDAYYNFIQLRTFAAMRSLGDNRFNRNRGNKQNWAKASGNQPQNDICGSDDNKKNRTLECLRSRGTFNRSSGQSSWRNHRCSIRRQCNSTSPVSQQCQQQWDTQTKPRICDCVNTAKNNKLKQVQDNYYGCLRNRGVRNVDQNNDDGKYVIQKMLASLCQGGRGGGRGGSSSNQTDPCNRPRGRGNGQGGNGQGGNWNGNGNGNGRGNGGWDNSGRGNGNPNSNWNNGRGNGGNGNNGWGNGGGNGRGQGGGWNGGGGSNSGSSGGNWGSNSGSSSSSGSNWNSGSSSSSGSSAWGTGNDEDYDVGPSQPSDGDLFSGMMNGQTDAFSSLGGGSGLTSGLGGGSGLTSGLSGLGGGGGAGGLLSSFGGGNGGGLLSSFTGGNSGGLGGGLLSSFTGGGGGSPLDFLSGGGGGLMDPSSLMGGGGGLLDSFGGKKKK